MMDLNPRKFYLDDIFDDFVTSKREQGLKCDIYEKDGDYHIEMDIPGFDKKDINIECDKGYLTVTAVKNEEDNDENKNYIRRERSYGKYQRSFYIGEVDSENVKAEFKHGMLKIVVPKQKEVETKKRIEIE